MHKRLNPILIVGFLNCELFRELDKFELPNHYFMRACTIDIVSKRLRHLTHLQLPTRAILRYLGFFNWRRTDVQPVSTHYILLAAIGKRTRGRTRRFALLIQPSIVGLVSEGHQIWKGSGYYCKISLTEEVVGQCYCLTGSNKYTW